MCARMLPVIESPDGLGLYADITVHASVILDMCRTGVCAEVEVSRPGDLPETSPLSCAWVRVSRSDDLP